MAEDYRYQPEHLSEPDKELVQRIGDALHEGNHTEGLELLRRRLEAAAPDEAGARGELRFLLGGFLIDYGGDLSRRELIQEGVEVFETNTEEIADLVGGYTVEYCLGNAKYSLYGHAVRSGQMKFRPENLQLLVEAKNHHWRAVKAIEQSGEEPHPQFYINLGNALDSSARVIEAIRYYDRALELDPTFGMAHLNRGMALGTLNRMSDTYSINMLLQQERHFRIAYADQRLAKHHRENAKARRKAVKKALEFHAVTEPLEDHEAHVAAETEAASPFRLFCIAEKLALNEHALYCQCIGAQSDSLRIPKSAAPIGGEFVPAMELLLNRIRAEFGLARMLYYRYINESMEAEEYEPEYSELFDNERLGLNVELLRTSFRLCFGVLDRIAFGVCTIFGLAEEKELIYFESFWKKPKPKTQQEKERWMKVNEADNWGLTALYSQATDLNVHGGEWRHYKDWRNRLEHEALILTASGELDLGPWIKKAAGARLESVDIEIFRKETLHLLQITAAAIFYFTYCVRREGIKAHDGQGVTTAIDKRERNAAL